MQVRYQDRHPRYECSHSRADHVATPRCGSVRADTVDEVVTGALLAAVQPDQIALALAAAGEVTARHARSARAAELAVERARYQADRAERAFHACEPENRLVARSLEARWEARLADLAEAHAALATQISTRPQLPSPGQLAATVADLPTLWSAPTPSDKDRKRLLRTLLGDVTITPSIDDTTLIDVGLRWKSGAAQQMQLTRRKSAVQLRNTDPAAIVLARRIGPTLDNAGLAAALNAAGHTTGTGAPFTVDAAGNLRHYQHIPDPGLLCDGERTHARSLSTSACPPAPSTNGSPPESYTPAAAPPTAGASHSRPRSSRPAAPGPLTPAISTPTSIRPPAKPTSTALPR